MKEQKSRAKWILIPFVLINLTSCTPPEGRDYKRGMEEVNKKHFTISLTYFERATKRIPDSLWAIKAAREGARVAYYELKDHKKAVEFFRFIVMHSEDSQERKEAQQRLGEIFLDNLQDYAQAIIEYSRLVDQNLPDQEKGQYRLGLARAYYYQNNLFQSESEIDQILKLKVEPPLRFSAMMLKGNILIARKEFQNAADIFQKLIREHPERAQQENVPMTLAVCYEEASDFKSALAVLEGLRDTYNPPEYIDLRIKRLRERQKNQPGARGFRK